MSNTEEREQLIESIGSLTVGDEPHQIRNFLGFNSTGAIADFIQLREATLKAEYEEKIREARKQGYIDGIKSDERSTDEVITRSTIRALDDIELYALDCTFGHSWGSKHVEKAVPIKSIESRIDYFKSTLSAQKKELEQDERC